MWLTVFTCAFTGILFDLFPWHFLVGCVLNSAFVLRPFLIDKSMSTKLCPKFEDLSCVQKVQVCPRVLHTLQTAAEVTPA